MDKQEVILEAVEYAVSRGATHLKIECEAQLGRGGYDDYDDSYCDHCDEGSVECGECYGSGEFDCSNCDGSGSITDPHDSTHTIDCPECSGIGRIGCGECEDGYYTCGECDGNWERSRSSSDDESWGNPLVCLDYILNYLGLAPDAQYVDNEIAERANASDWLRYIRFYNDHSVDSEVTATIDLRNHENVFKSVDLINAFASFAEAVGGTFDTSGAGLHMAFIFNEDGHYPDNSSRLPDDQLLNFSRSMKQLLPALYFLGATNETTRDLHYRQPNISTGLNPVEGYNGFDRNHKYSAIYYRGHAMEFRVFDTCYDRPEQVLDNFVVMSNSLKFLSDKYKSPGLEKKIARYQFGNDLNRELNRLFVEETHLDMLSRGLQKLKPSYYTVNDLKKQRSFKLNKGTLKTVVKKEEVKAKNAYDEYSERFDFSLIYQEEQIWARYMQSYIDGKPTSELRGMGNEAIRKAVEPAVLKEIEALKGRRSTATNYIKQHLERFKEGRQGRYQISLQ